MCHQETANVDMIEFGGCKLGRPQQRNDDEGVGRERTAVES